MGAAWAKKEVEDFYGGGDYPFANNPMFGTAVAKAGHRMRLPSSPLPSQFPWEDAFGIDIETTDLSRHSALTEVALFDPRGRGGKGTYRTWVITPGYIDKEGNYKTVSQEKFSKLVKDPSYKGDGPFIGAWFRRKATGKNAIYSDFVQPNLGNAEMRAFSDKAEQMTSAMDPGSSHIVKRTSFIDAMDEFVGILESKGGTNRAIFAHNAPFDFTRIGETLQAIEKSGGEADRAKATNIIDRMMSLAETAPGSEAYRGILGESGRRLQASKMSFAIGGDGWRLIRAFGRHEAPSRYAIRDTLTLARTLFTMIYGKAPIGIASMDVLSKAMGIAKGDDPISRQLAESYAHRGAADIHQERKVFKYLYSMASDISAGKQLANDKAKFLGILSTVEKREASSAYMKNLIEGKVYYDLGERLRFPSKVGQEPLGIEGQRTGLVVSMRAGEERFKGEIPYTRKVLAENWDEYHKAVRAFAERRGYDVDYKLIEHIINTTSAEDLKAMFHEEDLARKYLGFETFEQMAKSAPALKRELLRLTQAVGKDDVLKVLSANIPQNLRTSKTAAIAGAGMIAVGLAVAMAKVGDEEDNRDIDGMPEQGMAPEMRHATTEFGSGWEGILTAILPQSLTGHTTWSIENRMERFRRTIWQEPGRRAAMEADLERRQQKAQEELGELDMQGATRVRNTEMFDGLHIPGGSEMYAMKINKNKYIYEFDDADTLVLRKKGWFGLPTGDKMSIRLAGLDAPEVGGHKGDPLKPVRIAQDQPYGRTSSEVFRRLLSSQETLTLVFDPKQKTYGRSVGVLYGDQMQNLNLTLVKQGLAAYLPYGAESQSMVDRQQFKVAQQQAVAHKKGMWKEPFWQTYQPAAQAMGGNITFNTMTRMDRLARDQTTSELMMSSWVAQERGYVSEDDIRQASALGRRMRSGRKGSRRHISSGSGRIMGDPAHYNTIEGAPETGMAADRRGYYGFGSPWKMSSEAVEIALKNEWKAVKIKKASQLQEYSEMLSMARKQEAKPMEPAVIPAGASTDAIVAAQSRQGLIQMAVSARLTPDSYQALAYEGLIMANRGQDAVVDILENSHALIPLAGTSDAIFMKAKDLPAHADVGWARAALSKGSTKGDIAQAMELEAMTARANIKPKTSFEEFSRIMDEGEALSTVHQAIKPAQMKSARQSIEPLAKMQVGGGAPVTNVKPPSATHANLVKDHEMKMRAQSIGTRAERNIVMAEGNKEAAKLIHKSQWTGHHK